ncbi:MAG: cardiolipin synthase [Bacteroidales bacterium]|nr:cardiolipin synthase [Bacteroidales bacterium]
MFFFSSNTWLAIALQILYIITTVASVIVVIGGNRNPVKTLAWILLFFLLPFFGILFYIFFGMDYTRQRLISRKKRRKIISRHFPIDKKLLRELPPQYQTLATFLNHQNQYPLYSNNSINIYKTGEEKFSSLLLDIEQAQKFIHIQYYIIESDEIGNRVKDALIKKAQNGVEIRLLFDDVGCWRVPVSFFNEMRDAGIKTATFLEVRFHRLTSKINFRNHRKIVVIDGEIGYTGGMNIADRYWKGLDWGIWKDIHTRIEGDGVEALESAFLIDWYFITRELLPLKNYISENKLSIASNIKLQIVTGGPFGQWRDILHGYLKLIHTAKEYVYLQSPYFLPGESLLSALQTAAMSGVDVRLMLPEKSDSWIVQMATYSYLKSVMRAGVKVYFYQPGFLHSKLVVADDCISTIGSTNLDFRSFEHNFEINTFIYDTKTAVLLKNIFLEDLSNCVKVNLNSWIKRPLKTRFLESTIRLFSPLL